MSAILDFETSNTSTNHTFDTSWGNTSEPAWDDFDFLINDFKAKFYTYKEPRTIVLVSIYIPIFFLALGGNILVLLVIIPNRSMRSVTNYFLLNLSIADLLVTIVCIPLTVGETVYSVWIYGAFLCKTTGYLQGLSVAASVLTIMSLSLDRYVAIRHPMKSRRISNTFHARMVIVIIWVIAGSIMAPLLFVRHLEEYTLPVPSRETFARCDEKWPRPKDRLIYDIILFIFIYVIPGCIIIASYSSTGCRLMTGNQALCRQDSDVNTNYRIIAGRKRVARMLLAIAILFALSWLPYYILILYTDINVDFNKEQLNVILSFSLLLGHSHSAQNPILYCIMNKSFKQGLISVLKCRNLRDMDEFRSRDSQYTSLRGSQRRSAHVRKTIALTKNGNFFANGEVQTNAEGHNDNMDNLLKVEQTDLGETSKPGIFYNINRHQVKFKSSKVRSVNEDNVQSMSIFAEQEEER